ncbi:MAG: hypothetical protein AABW51_01430 [Nanoarchaeota archaeon]
MSEVVNFAVGIVLLVLGVPIGNFLAKMTKEELRDGQLWFKLIIFFSSIGAVISLILRNDFLLFSFLFIAVVASRSLISKKNKKVDRRKTKK